MILLGQFSSELQNEKKIQPENLPNQHIQYLLNGIVFTLLTKDEYDLDICLNNILYYWILSSTTSKHSNGMSQNTERVPQYED